MAPVDPAEFDNCYCDDEKKILEGYVPVDRFATLNNLVGEYQCVLFTAAWIVSHASLLHSRSLFEKQHNTQNSLFWNDSLQFLQLCYGAITAEINPFPNMEYKIMNGKTEMDLLLMSVAKFFAQSGFKLDDYKGK